MVSIWLLKQFIFGENDQNWVISVTKMTSYVKIWGNWSTKFFHKRFLKLFQAGLLREIWSKMSLIRSIWSKQVDVGENGKKIGHFGRQNDLIGLNLGKFVTKYSPKDSKNYFSQFY